MDYQITKAAKYKQDDTLVGVEIVLNLTNSGHVRSNVQMTLDGPEFQAEIAKDGNIKQNIWDWLVLKLTKYRDAWDSELATQVIVVENVGDVMGEIGSPTGTI